MDEKSLDSFLYDVPGIISTHGTQYLCTNTENLLIFNDLKVGSRTVERWFEIPYIRITIDTNSFKNFIPKEPTTETVINDILNKIPIKKDILFIYRNPFRKTITGLFEDFHQCVKIGRERDVRLFDKIVSNIDNNVLKKLVKQNEGVVHHLFNWDNPHNTNIPLAYKQELFSEMFLQFLKIKKDEGSLLTEHASPLCYSTYQMIKECMEGVQNFYLFDLDNKTLSLENTLNNYKKKSDNYENVNNSNISHFNNFTNSFKQDSIHFYISKILSIEYNFYFRLRNHTNNIKEINENDNSG